MRRTATGGRIARQTLTAAGALLLGAAACVSCAVARPEPGPTMVETSPPDAFLAPTDVIDADHPRIVALAEQLTAGAVDDRERAVRVHDFVRDEVRFGFQPEFYAVRASEVLSAGVGYCNTKSSLFIALLRAAGVPARPHFVEIDAGILRRLVDPGTAYVDHSFTEVWLDGRWVRTDSYIVDPALSAAARTRLFAEGRAFGYGVHVDGTGSWTGTDDAFSQCVEPIGESAYTRRDLGVHADVLAFYRDASEPSNRRGLALRLLGRWAFPAANRRAEAVRARAGS
ncbi:MAG: transglutaminase-like domain-containing protein [Planctomycetota bacterium]